jgi:competence protein ComEC
MIIIEAKYKRFFYTLISLVFLFLLSLSFEYVNYKSIKKEELFETKVYIVNIYEKENSLVLKLKNKSFTFFTSVSKNNSLKKLDTLNIAFITTHIDFYNFLKGFYAQNIYYESLEKEKSLKQSLVENINLQHSNEKIRELFQALFLAIPLSSDLRDFFSAISLSHLIALSGFHLAVLSYVSYIILYPLYYNFHKKHFPYRNKKFDILILTCIGLLFYLIFTGFVPSLLRAFIMLIVSIFLLRSNIKIFSFYSLFLVLFIILILYPKYLFSLGLWFSFFGVFYIFLFIQYFKNIKSKIFQVLFFNYWIYFALNPIIHYFFPLTSYEQLISPLLTIIFILFYPFELFLHFINYGFLLDEYLEMLIQMDIKTYEKSTSLSFLIFFIICSFLSIKSKYSYFILNFFIVVYSLYLFL